MELVKGPKFPNFECFMLLLHKPVHLAKPKLLPVLVQSFLLDSNDLSPFLVPDPFLFQLSPISVSLHGLSYQRLSRPIFPLLLLRQLINFHRLSFHLFLSDLSSFFSALLEEVRLESVGRVIVPAAVTQVNSLVLVIARVDLFLWSHFNEYTVSLVLWDELFQIAFTHIHPNVFTQRPVQHNVLF